MWLGSTNLMLFCWSIAQTCLHEIAENHFSRESSVGSLLYTPTANQKWWIDFDGSEAGLLHSSLYQLIIMCIYSVWKKRIFLFHFAYHYSLPTLIWQYLIDSWVLCNQYDDKLCFLNLAEKKSQEEYIQIRNKVFLAFKLVTGYTLWWIWWILSAAWNI